MAGVIETTATHRRWRLPPWMLRETYALPVDVFRVLVGFISLAYFLSLLWQEGDFTRPDGLLDHPLIYQIFWFARFSLFQPGLTDAWFYAAFVVGCIGSVGIVSGYRVKLCAAVLYVIAVSAYRWNFMVMYVDDSIVHLMLLWLMLLPVGRTLNIQARLREGSACWERWTAVTVPGTAVYCLLGNLCLIYLVSGLWKLESPFWRQGFAMYATVRLPIGWFPDAWGPQDMPLLTAATYGALVIEPLLPVLLLQRVGHLLKWLGLAGLLALHLGILATLRIPFANVACLGGGVLFFRDEIMHAILRRRRAAVSLGYADRADRCGRIAIILLAVLCVAMTRRLPFIGAISRPAYAVLWVGGVAQDYQLFNWIDKKNVRGENHVLSIAHDPVGEPIDPKVMFPTSLRGMLLQAYLHDVRWIKVPDEDKPAVKHAILERLAQRYCRQRLDDHVMVSADIQRIEPGNEALDHPQTEFLMEFKCRAGEAVLCQTMLHPDRSPDCD